MLRSSAEAHVYLTKEGDDLALREEVARYSNKYKIPAMANPAPVWDEDELRAGKEPYVVTCAFCNGLLVCSASKLRRSSARCMHWQRHSTAHALTCKQQQI